MAVLKRLMGKYAEIHVYHQLYLVHVAIFEFENFSSHYDIDTDARFIHISIF